MSHYDEWVRHLADRDPPDIDRDVNVSSRNTAESAWTFGTIYLFFNDKVQALDRRIMDRFTENEKRIDFRLTEADRRIVDRITEFDKRAELRHSDAVKSNEAALQAQKEAVLKAETANEKRFESVNEFRGTLSDQTARLMPRVETDARMVAFSEKIGDMSARLDRMEGKGSGQASLWGLIVGGIGIIGILITIGLTIVTIVTRGRVQ